MRMHLNYMASTFQAASIVPNLQLFSCDFLCLNLDGFGLFKKKKKSTFFPLWIKVLAVNSQLTITKLE